MKVFAITSAVALASVATAQLSNIPSCALQCFIGPLTSDGCSSLTDFACHCKQGAKLLTTVQPCVKGACSDADQATTIAAVESTCKEAGVPIEIPDASSAVASSAVASATSAAASAASSAAESATSAVASGTSAVASAVSSLSSLVSSAASSAASAASSNAASATSAAGSAAASASSSSAPSQFTGAAAQATQAAGLLGAAALAIFAL